MNENMILLSCFIILSTFFIVCIDDDIQKKGEDENEIDFNYNIEITPNFQEKYSIYLPIPLTEGNNISKIMDEIQIKTGNGTINIIETKFGFALHIKLNGKIVLESKGRSVDGYFNHLSMRNDTNISEPTTMTQNWFYCDKPSDNGSIQISLFCESRNMSNNKKHMISSINGEIETNGWLILVGNQTIEMT